MICLKDATAQERVDIALPPVGFNGECMIVKEPDMIMKVLFLELGTRKKKKFVWPTVAGTIHLEIPWQPTTQCWPRWILCAAPHNEFYWQLRIGFC